MKKIQCGGCGCFFASDTMFEAHRVGDYERERKPRWGFPRRCLTEHEMRKKGWVLQEMPVDIYVDDSPTRVKRMVWLTTARAASYARKKEGVKKLQRKT